MNNMPDAIRNLKGNKALMQSLTQSKEAKQLMRMLSEKDGGAALKKAANAAERGNTADMAKMIAEMMKDPQAAALIQRINDAAQGKDK